MPPTWQSRYPIYYAFAAVSSVSGVDTGQVLAPLAAALLAMAAIGMFLVASEVFGAMAAFALIGMLPAALDRMALHTILNPYCNQTWGFFAMPFTSLQAWAGDLPGLVPFDYFLSLPSSLLGTLLVLVVIGLAVWGLVGQPRSLTWGVGGLLAIGMLLAAYLRHRQYGYYFHFTCSLHRTAGAADRRGGRGPAEGGGFGLLAVVGVAAIFSIVSEIKATGYQLPPATISCLPGRDRYRREPRYDSTCGPDQLWAAYFLAARPLCSQLPLLGTDYARVAISGKARYIVAIRTIPRPADADGAPLRQNEGYFLYRENPLVPGPSACTQRRYDRIYSGVGHALHQRRAPASRGRPLRIDTKDRYPSLASYRWIRRTRAWSQITS